MKGNGILHTILCLPFIFCVWLWVCLFFGFFFFAPTIDIYKHNVGIMVLQTRLPLMGIFKQTGFYDIVYTGVVCRLWRRISLLHSSVTVTRSDVTETWGLLAGLTHKCKCSTWFYGDWERRSAVSHPMLCAPLQTWMIPPHLYEF